MVYTGRVDRQKLEMMMMGSAGWLNRGGIMIQSVCFQRVYCCTVLCLRSGSGRIRIIWPDPDPHQNGADPKHCMCFCICILGSIFS